MDRIEAEIDALLTASHGNPFGILGMHGAGREAVVRTLQPGATRVWVIDRNNGQVAAELPRAMQKCHHLHGGIGVDVTHSMHRYYSQSKDLARWLGGAALRLERLGAGCSSI